MRNGALFIALALVLCATAIMAGQPGQGGTLEQGIKGRASQGGVLVETIEVRAYLYEAGSFGPLTGVEQAARATTGTDGTYALELKPGRYVVEALKKKPGNGAATPEPGDLYCLYSGSPVTVAPGRWTGVGLYMVEVVEETREAAGSTILAGSLRFGGEQVERAYLYVYKAAEGAFRGPADLLQPVGKGAFSVRLPPGDYFLVARKRMRGGSYGPIDTGDLFNFYPMNPVTLTEGDRLTVTIPLVERLSQLEEEEGGYKGVKVRVMDSEGNPQAGHYVLAYGVPARMGPPAATAGPTDEKGEAFINLPPNAPHLRARSSLGGPLAKGEAYGDVKYDPDRGEPVYLIVTPGEEK